MSFFSQTAYYSIDEDAGLTSADLDNAYGFCFDAAKSIEKSLKTLKKIK